MFPQWANPLSWLIVPALLVPPLIVLLYFLKLKRVPLEVPSTYLWHKSIEDLHVNSIWQRLRQSLLLFLQLLLMLLVILALLAPHWRGSRLQNNRLVLLIDNSASMAAVDVAPTRLDEAKRQAAALIDEMQSGDSGMIVSFSDGATVVQSFTDNHKLLKRRLLEIPQSHRTTDIEEALRVASGLANPGQSATDAGDKQVAEARPADVFIYSDGRFADVKGLFEDRQGFSWGNLNPNYVPIGDALASNVAVTVFSTRRNEERPEELQAFASLRNFGSDDATVIAELYQDDVLLAGDADDAREVTVPAGEDAAVVFPLTDFLSGVLRLRIEPADALEIDNQAWAAVNDPRKAKVLCLSPECVPAQYGPLQYALTTGRALTVADVRIESPDFLDTEEYQKLAAGGAFDLIVYDRCAPREKPEPKMPQANTLFIGALPPLANWSAEEVKTNPQIIDVDQAHPLMQLVAFDNVLFASGTPLVPPPSANVLIDAEVGPLMAIADRDAIFEDAVLGLPIVEEGRFNTDWPRRPSFPVFVLNVLQYLGGTTEASTLASVRPGRPVMLRLETPANELTVVAPNGRRETIKRGRQDAFYFAETDLVGSYEVRDGDGVVQRFAVNLFDERESEIDPRPEFRAGGQDVQRTETASVARKEGWKLLLLLALAVLLIEWYIYNRRVYI